MSVEGSQPPMGGKGLYRGGVVEELVFGRVWVRSSTQRSMDSAGHGSAHPSPTCCFERRVPVWCWACVSTTGGGWWRRVHQPQESVRTLEAVQLVQAHLHREDFPCPAPLVAPAALANGSQSRRS
jgi:hypothetical protein